MIFAIILSIRTNDLAYGSGELYQYKLSPDSCLETPEDFIITILITRNIKTMFYNTNMLGDLALSIKESFSHMGKIDIQIEFGKFGWIRTFPEYLCQGETIRIKLTSDLKSSLKKEILEIIGDAIKDDEYFKGDQDRVDFYNRRIAELSGLLSCEMQGKSKTGKSI